ncbi:hypothetical protein FE782_16705 [Paenibacillus antri]|uniref:DUF2269 family protein n=1 Tax=Paenibacillus antri TaxID=2582848 RepID=A0A5R9G5G9_9BACL|nr:hypothetical protein [Paenibacillus antri]TLS51031.1 hypothetical protein FE782_16705 [Paenibacillus antri]
MVEFVLFLHVLGSLAVGFYLLLPFVAMRLSGLDPHAQVGFAKGIFGLNRIGQWLLIVQFLTGGYLISKAGVSVPWMIVVIVLFVALGAMSGMIAGPLKRIIANGGEGKAAAAKDASKLSTFSGVASLLVLVLLILMYYSDII